MDELPRPSEDPPPFNNIFIGDLLNMFRNRCRDQTDLLLIPSRLAYSRKENKLFPEYLCFLLPSLFFCCKAFCSTP
jgi:hypothetical protein